MAVYKKGLSTTYMSPDAGRSRTTHPAQCWTPRGRPRGGHTHDTTPILQARGASKTKTCTFAPALDQEMPEAKLGTTVPPLTLQEERNAVINTCVATSVRAHIGSGTRYHTLRPPSAYRLLRHRSIRRQTTPPATTAEQPPPRRTTTSLGSVVGGRSGQPSGQQPPSVSNNAGTRSGASKARGATASGRADGRAGPRWVGPSSSTARSRSRSRRRWRRRLFLLIFPQMQLSSNGDARLIIRRSVVLRARARVHTYTHIHNPMPHRRRGNRRPTGSQRKSKRNSIIAVDDTRVPPSPPPYPRKHHLEEAEQRGAKRSRAEQSGAKRSEAFV